MESAKKYSKKNLDLNWHSQVKKKYQRDSDVFWHKKIDFESPNSMIFDNNVASMNEKRSKKHVEWFDVYVTIKLVPNVVQGVS